MGCKYCGQDLGHAPKCPARPAEAANAKAQDGETEERREKRIDDARRRLAEMVEERKQEVMDAVEDKRLKRPEDHRADQDEIAEAREIIAELLSAEDLPKVTVAREHLESILKDGLRQRPTSYQKEVAAIVGTLGRDPLLPKDQDRVILELDLKPDELSPRFTGPTKVFEGVVGINSTVVPPDRIRVIDPKEKAEPEEPKAA